MDQGNRGFFAYVEPIIRARQGKSGDDLISVVVNTQVNGQPIEHQKALRHIADGRIEVQLSFVEISLESPFTTQQVSPDEESQYDDHECH